MRDSSQISCLEEVSQEFVIFNIQNLTLDHSPSPDSYKLPSLFSPNNTTSTFAIHNKGAKSFAFGTGREDLKKKVPMRNVGYAHLGADMINPGPA